MPARSLGEGKLEAWLAGFPRRRGGKEEKNKLRKNLSFPFQDLVFPWHFRLLDEGSRPVVSVFFDQENVKHKAKLWTFLGRMGHPCENAGNSNGNRKITESHNHTKGNQDTPAGMVNDPPSSKVTNEPSVGQEQHRSHRTNRARGSALHIRFKTLQQEKLYWRLVLGVWVSLGWCWLSFSYHPIFLSSIITLRTACTIRKGLRIRYSLSTLGQNHHLVTVVQTLASTQVLNRFDSFCIEFAPESLSNS